MISNSLWFRPKPLLIALIVTTLLPFASASLDAYTGLWNTKISGDKIIGESKQGGWITKILTPTPAPAKKVIITTPIVSTPPKGPVAGSLEVNPVAVKAAALPPLDKSGWTLLEKDSDEMSVTSSDGKLRITMGSLKPGISISKREFFKRYGSDGFGLKLKRSDLVVPTGRLQAEEAGDSETSVTLFEQAFILPKPEESPTPSSEATGAPPPPSVAFNPFKKSQEFIAATSDLGKSLLPTDSSFEDFDWEKPSRDQIKKLSGPLRVRGSGGGLAEDKSGRVVFYSANFIPDLDQAITDVTPKISMEDAGSLALQKLGQHFADLKATQSWNAAEGSGPTAPNMDVLKKSLNASKILPLFQVANPNERPKGTLEIGFEGKIREKASVRLVWVFEDLYLPSVDPESTYTAEVVASDVNGGLIGKVISLEPNIQRSTAGWGENVLSSGQTLYNGKVDFVADKVLENGKEKYYLRNQKDQTSKGSTETPAATIAIFDQRRDAPVVDQFAFISDANSNAQFGEVGQEEKDRIGVSLLWGFQKVSAFVKRLTGWVKDEEIKATILKKDDPFKENLVHTWASYEPQLDRFFFAAHETRPDVTLDLIGHEYAHAFLSQKKNFSTTFWTKTVVESIADTLGILAKLDQSGDYSYWLLGEGLNGEGQSYENYGNGSPEPDSPRTYLGYYFPTTRASGLCKQFDWCIRRPDGTEVECNNENNGCSGAWDSSEVLTRAWYCLVNGCAGKNDWGIAYNVPPLHESRKEGAAMLAKFLFNFVGVLPEDATLFTASETAIKLGTTLWGEEGGKKISKAMRSVYLGWPLRLYRPKTTAQSVDPWELELAATVDRDFGEHGFVFDVTTKDFKAEPQQQPDFSLITNDIQMVAWPREDYPKAAELGNPTVSVKLSLKPNTKYFWRVNAFSQKLESLAEATSGDPGEPQDMQTLPKKTEILAPENGKDVDFGDQPLEMKWKNINGAIGYKIYQIEVGPGYQPVKEGDQFKPVADGNPFFCSVADGCIDPHQEEVVYPLYGVRDHGEGRCLGVVPIGPPDPKGEENAGEMSNIVCFGVTLPAPKNLHPSDGDSVPFGAAVEFKWEAPGASKFRLTFYERNADGSIGNAFEDSPQYTVIEPRYSSLTASNRPNGICWKVQILLQPDDRPGAESGTVCYMPDLGTLKPVSPLERGTVDYAAPAFTWAHDGNAPYGYLLIVDIVGSISPMTTGDPTPQNTFGPDHIIVKIDDGHQRSFTGGSLHPSQDYYWTVVVLDPYGKLTKRAFGTTRFTTTAVPQPQPTATPPPKTDQPSCDATKQAPSISCPGTPSFGYGVTSNLCQSPVQFGVQQYAGDQSQIHYHLQICKSSGSDVSSDCQDHTFSYSDFGAGSPIQLPSNYEWAWRTQVSIDGCATPSPFSGWLYFVCDPSWPTCPNNLK